jgi:hypothetical protein
MVAARMPLIRAAIRAAIRVAIRARPEDQPVARKRTGPEEHRSLMPLAKL